MASKWQVIGEAFPLSEKRLDDIGTTEGDEECLRQMIEAYMLRSDLSHTWDEIVNVLKKIGEDSHADKIFKEHVAPCKLLLDMRVPLLLSINRHFWQVSLLFLTSHNLVKITRSSTDHFFLKRVWMMGVLIHLWVQCRQKILTFK